MKITVHADDMGLSASATEKIVEIHRQGRLDRASIIPNGEAFLRAVSALKENEGLDWSVHLNLVEGRALCDPDQVPLLVDRAGRFRRTFLTLWLVHNLAPWLRMRLLAQIEREIEAQIRRTTEALPGRAITVDSHQHVHHLPFVFKLLLRRSRAWGIEAIRVAREPLVLPPPTRQGLSCLCSANLLKYVVLRTFSRRCLRASRGAGVRHPDYLVGVLFSGKMSLDVIRRTLRSIAARHGGGDPEVELVFHPCPANRRELTRWGTLARNRRFYASRDRHAEVRTLMAQDFRRCLARIT